MIFLSSTLDLEVVRRVGAVFRGSLDSLGFATRWATMPEEMGRAGHLVAERRGKSGRARLLLIGHLDTVVRPDGATFVRRDSVAKGIGATDMKGGDVVILYALRALRAARALDDLSITVVLTGDEEQAGAPLQASRRDLIEAGRRTAEQLERARNNMREIVARHLPGTDATIAFDDEYPAMSPTPGNDRALAAYDSVSRALGYGPVAALDPGLRGAGDISFVAPFMDGLDGLGALGDGSHTPEESVDLSTLEMQTARAALLIRRLGTRPAPRRRL